MAKIFVRPIVNAPGVLANIADIFSGAAAFGTRDQPESISIFQNRGR